MEKKRFELDETNEKVRQAIKELAYNLKIVKL